MHTTSEPDAARLMTTLPQRNNVGHSCDFDQPAALELPRRTNVLGVGISAMSLETAVNLTFEAIDQKRKGYVCVTGVHGVIEAQDSEEFRNILNESFLTTPDGMPMVWVGKWNGHSEIQRVYGPDLMLAVLERSVDAGVTHYFYGGGDGVAQLLAQRVRERFPGLQVVGAYTPPYRPLNRQEEQTLVEDIAALRPDCIWVGLSTPRQERFMRDYICKLDATLMFGVGAAFDFHAGLVRQAPKWMQQSGLEWAFRLCMEPRRLWRRYLINNSRFVLQIARRRLFQPATEVER